MGSIHERLAVVAVEVRQDDVELHLIPKPPDSAKPMPTVADTSESVVSSLSRMATNLMAEWKHAL